MLEAVYVNHELFKTTKHERSSTINGYQESILWKIRELNAAVVIKSSTGSSSMGIHISEDFEDAKAYLLSDAFCEDVIVEKKFVGEEYGIEIHGSSGNYVVTPPYRIFRYDKGELNDPLGLTTLKYGPMTGELKKSTLVIVQSQTYQLWRELQIAKGILPNQIKPVRLIDTPEKEKFFMGLKERNM